MSRRPRHRTNEPLPPPLPPETRTVGQLVAESLRLYGRKFWLGLGIGVGPAVVGILNAELDGTANFVVIAVGGTLLWSASYLAAVVVATGERPTMVAFAVSVVAIFPFLAQRSLVLPGFDFIALAYFALLGLGVPAAVVEKLGFWAALARGLRLARADFIHALGSLATLVIVVFLTGGVLFLLLQGVGESTIKVAAFLTLLVLTPLFLLGSALLYYDQAARVRSSPAD